MAGCNDLRTGETRFDQRQGRTKDRRYINTAPLRCCIQRVYERCIQRILATHPSTCARIGVRRQHVQQHAAFSRIVLGPGYACIHEVVVTSVLRKVKTLQSAIA
jgi:hypothetical protein